MGGEEKGWSGLKRNQEGKNGESIDKLDSSFTALGHKKVERNGEVEQTEEQYGIKGGFLSLYI